MQDVLEGRSEEVRLVAARVDVRVRRGGFIAALGDIIVRCDPDRTEPAPVPVAGDVHLLSPLTARIASGDAERTRIALSPERPALAVAWPAGRRTVRFDVSAAIEAVEVDGGRATLRLEGGGGVFLASDAVARYVVDHGAHGVMLDVMTESAGSLCILVASDPPSGGDAALLRTPELLERITMAWLGRRAAEAPRLNTADTTVDGLWEWCTRRVVVPADRAPPFEHAGLLALGALVSGAPHVADLLVRAALASPFDGITSDTRSVALLIAAAGRTVAWTGDASLAAQYWPSVDAALMRLASAAIVSGDGDALALRAAAARESAIVADAAGARPRAAQLTAESLRLSRAAACTVHGPWLHALRIAGHGDADPDAYGSRAAPNPALATWAALSSAHSSALGGLRELAGELTGDSDAVAAALAACAILTGLFGVDPDASRGRIALRPAVPVDFLPFQLEGLRAGDAEFRFRAELAAGAMRFALEQTSGPVPFQLVFEPRLCVTRVRACKVDGAPADLAVRRSGEDWVTPVQLTLDAARVVEIEVETDA